MIHQKRMRHSKFRNTGILFELLTKQVTADIISGKDSSAAKEAISKAFGVGIGSSLIFSDILISKDKLGAPNVIIEQKVLNKLIPASFSSCEIALSISDDYPVVVAFAMITFIP